MTAAKYNKVIKHINNRLKAERTVSRFFISCETYLSQFPKTIFLSFNSSSKKNPFSKVLFTGIYSNSLITNFA